MPEAFRPFPFMTNPHVQTVLGHWFSWTRDNFKADVLHVPLADGDTIAVHDSPPAEWKPGDSIVVLVHGLGGSHRSDNLRRLTNRFVGQGVRVFRVDLRGAGLSLPTSRRLYTAACSSDIRSALELIGTRHPGSPIALAGFSLGGNIVLKMAGEAADRPIPGLCAVAAVAPPIDLILCSERISRLPFYDSHYVRVLRRQVEAHAVYFPDVSRVSFPARTTLRIFDDVYTAPRWGYENSTEYYRDASALRLIDRVDMPTFILAARDDPFVASEPIETLPRREAWTIAVTPHGGHLGFLGSDGAGGIRWGEGQILAWMLERLRRA